MTDDSREVASPSQTAGPFFHLGLSPRIPHSSEQELQLVIAVTDGNRDPVSDALVELWYIPATHENAAAGSAAFARSDTDGEGRCAFALAPPAGENAADARSSRHINVCVFARGLLRQLHTRLYFDGDATLEGDPVLTMVPPERRHTLIARRDDQSQAWLFTIRLQGDDETVFFAM